MLWLLIVVEQSIVESARFVSITHINFNSCDSEDSSALRRALSPSSIKVKSRNNNHRSQTKADPSLRSG